jgi:hypothetical protein
MAVHISNTESSLHGWKYCFAKMLWNGQEIRHTMMDKSRFSAPMHNRVLSIKRETLQCYKSYINSIYQGAIIRVLRPRLHETGTKSNRDHLVSVIV